MQQQTASTDHAHRILINASGHIQELPRNFSLISLAGVGVTVGNVWVSLLILFPKKTPTTRPDINFKFS